MTPPTLVFLFKNVVAILGPLKFLMNFRMRFFFFFHFCKTTSGILIGIALNPQITSGNIILLKILSLSIPKLRMSFHLLGLSQFLSNLFCSFQCVSLACTWRNLPKYFICKVMVKGIIFLISFLDFLPLVCRNATNFYTVTLYPTKSYFA